MPEMDINHKNRVGVGCRLATPLDLAKYNDAKNSLDQFLALFPIPTIGMHERLFFVAFDGAENCELLGPEYASNVGKIHDQMSRARSLALDHVVPHYVEAAVTRRRWLKGGHDIVRGSSYESTVKTAYNALVSQANRWIRDDPDAVIRVHSLGFGRGACHIPGFANLLHVLGIPDLPSKIVADDGTVTYARNLVDPGQVVQTVALLDPVGVAIPADADRSMPPSVVSGVQITAADEFRVSFASERLISPGQSEDGRFLNLRVPGAHSDIGGGYLRDGIAIRCGNLMRDYFNSLWHEPLLGKEHVPVNRYLNVVHRSTDGYVRLSTVEGLRWTFESIEAGYSKSFLALAVIICLAINICLGINFRSMPYLAVLLGSLAAGVVGFRRSNYRLDYK